MSGIKCSIVLKKVKDQFFLEKICKGSGKDREPWFLFESRSQSEVFHPEIFNLNKVKEMKSVILNKRTIQIELDENLTKKYLDQSKEDFKFNEKYLLEEEEDDVNKSESESQIEKKFFEQLSNLEKLIKIKDESFSKIKDEKTDTVLQDKKIKELELKIQLVELERLKINQAVPAQRSDVQVDIYKIEKRFNLDKFEGRSDVRDFLIQFEEQCVKFSLFDDQIKLDLIKNFVNDKVNDWLAVQFKRYPNMNWYDLKSKLLKVYANQGWVESTKAINYGYLGGKLSEYAIKKQKLLLDQEASLSDSFIIKLIVAGLPKGLFEKLNKNELLSVDDLLAELIRMEGEFVFFKKEMTKSNQTKDVRRIQTQDVKRIQSLKSSNKYCTKCKTTTHNFEECWFNKDDKEKKKMINTIEIDLNESTNSNNSTNSSEVEELSDLNEQDKNLN